MACAPALVQEPVGCGDLAFLIMQTRSGTMDHKCSVTKTRDCVTWSSRQREGGLPPKAPRAGAAFWLLVLVFPRWVWRFTAHAKDGGGLRSGESTEEQEYFIAPKYPLVSGPKAAGIGPSS